MIHHHSSISDKYRWGVSTPADTNDQILLSIESDMLCDTFCRIRLSAEDARDMASVLNQYAQDLDQ